MGRPVVNRFPDASSLADGVAHDLYSFISARLDTQNIVNVALTGGTIGIASLASARELPFNNLDLSRLHIWWGDERYVSKTSEDRNALQARKAWIDSLEIPSANLHEFPYKESGLDAAKAALVFSEQCQKFDLTFDLMLMGMGPDGHIASIFPGRTSEAGSNLVFAELDSPKPPRERLSFNYSVINASDEIWFTVAGSDKAEAVSKVFAEAPSELPASLVRGKEKTVWYVDQTAGNLVWGC